MSRSLRRSVAPIVSCNIVCTESDERADIHSRLAQAAPSDDGLYMRWDEGDLCIPSKKHSSDGVDLRNICGVRVMRVFAEYLRPSYIYSL